MPRISTERREANRVRIVAAARRCFSRNGFHETSMPDIAAAAGVSVGAPYRYFTSKEEIILEIAGDAFRVVFEPAERLAARGGLSVADLVVELVQSLDSSPTAEVDGQVVVVEELLRCAVQAWGELLRHDGLRQQANAGFDRVVQHLSRALQVRPGPGAADDATSHLVDLDHAARLVMALVHGLVLQRTAFGLTDPAGVAADLRLLLGPASLPTASGTSGAVRDTSEREGVSPS